jgi:hypothetical protein
MSSTPEELRGQIAEARERLGATVEELAAKADLRSRARHKAAEAKEHMQQTVHHTAEQMRDSAAHAAHRVQERSQEQVHTAMAKAAQIGRHPVPVAVTGGVVALAVGLAVRGRGGMGQIPERTARAYRRTARGYRRRVRAQRVRMHRGRAYVLSGGRAHACGRRH